MTRDAVSFAESFDAALLSFFKRGPSIETVQNRGDDHDRRPDRLLHDVEIAQRATLIVVVWVCLNLFGVTHFDAYPFILLNLFLSMLASVQARARVEDDRTGRDVFAGAGVGLEEVEGVGGLPGGRNARGRRSWAIKLSCRRWRGTLV